MPEGHLQQALTNIDRAQDELMHRESTELRPICIPIVGAQLELVKAILELQQRMDSIYSAFNRLH